MRIILKLLSDHSVKQTYGDSFQQLQISNNDLEEQIKDVYRWAKGWNH